MTTQKFFTAWQVYTKGIAKLLEDAGLPADTEVWQGADGSYAAGDSTDIYDTDPETDPETDLDHYTYSGTVSEFTRD